MIRAVRLRTAAYGPAPQQRTAEKFAENVCRFHALHIYYTSDCKELIITSLTKRMFQRETGHSLLPADYESRLMQHVKTGTYQL